MKRIDKGDLILIILLALAFFLSIFLLARIDFLKYNEFCIERGYDRVDSWCKSNSIFYCGGGTPNSISCAKGNFREIISIEEVK